MLLSGDAEGHITISEENGDCGSGDGEKNSRRGGEREAKKEQVFKSTSALFFFQSCSRRCLCEGTSSLVRRPLTINTLNLIPGVHSPLPLGIGQINHGGDDKCIFPMALVWKLVSLCLSYFIYLLKKRATNMAAAQQLVW